MNQKTVQVEHGIARAISSAIPELSDPRLPMIVTVERVRITPDWLHARVYVSCMGDIAPTVAALNSAKGYLQRALTKHMNLKRTPLLEFFDAKDDPLGLL
jgi:ribosome-binding factor A